MPPLIKYISYNQRNSISRTSPRLAKWILANPPQLLIAAANITGHKWLHPPKPDLADQTQPKIISVIYACVSLWQKDAFMEMHPSMVIHFIMIYGKTIREKCENINIVHPEFKVAAFSPPFAAG